MEGKGSEKISEETLQHIETVLETSVEVGQEVLLEKIDRLLLVLVSEMDKKIIEGLKKEADIVMNILRHKMRKELETALGNLSNTKVQFLKSVFKINIEVAEQRIVETIDSILHIPVIGLRKSVADLKRDFRQVMSEMLEKVMNAIRD